jgi:hypothetical protein
LQRLLDPSGWVADGGTPALSAFVIELALSKRVMAKCVEE